MFINFLRIWIIGVLLTPFTPATPGFAMPRNPGAIEETPRCEELLELSQKESGLPELTRILLRYPVDSLEVSCLDDLGNTMLHHIFSREQSLTADWFLELSDFTRHLAGLLLAHGARTDQTNAFGLFPYFELLPLERYERILNSMKTEVAGMTEKDFFPQEKEPPYFFEPLGELMERPIACDFYPPVGDYLEPINICSTQELLQLIEEKTNW